MFTLNPKAPVYKSLDTQHWERLNNMEAPKNIAWVLNNKKGILNLHSSEHACRPFDSQCTFCQRYFKSCMIWSNGHSELRGEPKCRWCHADLDSFDDDHKFEIGQHIHCNRIRQIACGRGYLTLVAPRLPRPPRERTRPPKKEPELKFADLRSPEITFVAINPRMSQKERKKLVAEEHAKERALMKKEAILKEMADEKAALEKKKRIALKEQEIKRAAAEKMKKADIEKMKKTAAEERAKKRANSI